jgi:hypothetical protein
MPDVYVVVAISSRVVSACQLKYESKYNLTSFKSTLAGHHIERSSFLLLIFYRG